MSKRGDMNETTRVTDMKEALSVGKLQWLRRQKVESEMLYYRLCKRDKLFFYNLIITFVVLDIEI